MRAMLESQSFVNTLQLHSESHCRRLFKARHHEMDSLEIQARTTASMAVNIIKNSSIGLQFFQRRRTVYSFDIRSDARRSHAIEAGTWTLMKRYSEFADFRAVLLSLTRRWEAQLDGDERKVHSREFELISNSLRRPIMPNFPRKHMRRDNQQIITERRNGLRQFVRMLLDVYVDLSVDLDSHQRRDGTTDLLREIYDQLEAFLSVPTVHKEMERRHTAAVLALEDVEAEEEMDHEEGDRVCCICLEEANYKEEEEEVTSRRSCLVTMNKLVQLPCCHQFHEDCVLEWFNTSTTCPLCRKAAVSVEATPSFVVEA